MLSQGVRYPWDSLEESLAVIAYQRRAEVEFLKLITLVNAIILVGNRISAAVTGGDSPGGDSVKKNIDALESLMLPHRAEEREVKAKKVKGILEREAAGGPLKIKVMGDDNRRGAGRLRRQR